VCIQNILIDNDFDILKYIKKYNISSSNYF